MRVSVYQEKDKVIGLRSTVYGYVLQYCGVVKQQSIMHDEEAVTSHKE